MSESSRRQFLKQAVGFTAGALLPARPEVKASDSEMRLEGSLVSLDAPTLVSLYEESTVIGYRIDTTSNGDILLSPANTFAPAIERPMEERCLTYRTDFRFKDREGNLAGRGHSGIVFVKQSGQEYGFFNYDFNGGNKVVSFEMPTLVSEFRGISSPEFPTDMRVFARRFRMQNIPISLVASLPEDVSAPLINEYNRAVEALPQEKREFAMERQHIALPYWAGKILINPSEFSMSFIDRPVLSEPSEGNSQPPPIPSYRT